MTSAAAVLAALSYADGETLFVPDDPRPGSWVGGPSAVVHDGQVHLAYRLRRPVGEGRGFANVIASSDDGRHFRTVAVIGRDRHDAESLERPCLVRTPEGKWRLYLSCATAGTKHWRVDLLESAELAGLPDAIPRTVLPGDLARVAVKDPVIVRDGGIWHLWASCHPLDDPAATDRMTTEYATSPDGVDWTWQGTALRGTPGSWDARGVRFAAVLPVEEGWLALYDGRATAEQNWDEVTGAALAPRLGAPFQPTGENPVFVSPHGTGGLRYVSLVTDPAGRLRVYYESARDEGAHVLRTQVLDP